MGRSGPVADGRHAAAEGAAGRRGAVAHAALGRCAHSLWLPSHARIGGWRRLPSGRSGDEDYRRFWRSEEHTSELQSLMRISYAVFCLKKKIKTTIYKDCK